MLAIALCYIAIHLQSVRAPFFPLDDIQELYHIRSRNSWIDMIFFDFYGFFRPVKNLLFIAFDALYRSGGMVPVHALAISVGLFSLIMVNMLFRRLLDSHWCLAASAIWLLAPTMVSSTAWLSAVNLQMMTGFAAASLIFYYDPGAQNGEQQWRRLGLCWIFTMLALTSYEGAISLAPILFAIDFYLRPERLRNKRVWIQYAVLASAFVLYMILRDIRGTAWELQGSFTNMARDSVIVSSPYFTLLHLSDWLWPFGRQALFGGYYWGQVSIAYLTLYAVLLWGLIAFALFARKRYPIQALGMAWFLLGFLPMSNILGFRNGPWGDYYMVLASMGLALLFVDILRRLAAMLEQNRNKIVLAVFALLIGWRIAATIESFAWSAAWNSTRQVYENSYKTFPEAFDIMLELAKVYFEQGEYRKAEELVKQAHQIDPKRLNGHAIKALIAQRENRIEDAKKITKELLEISDEEDVWANYFLGHLTEEYDHDKKRAAQYYRKALDVSIAGWNQDALLAANALAILLAQEGNTGKAIQLWEQLVRVDPEDSYVHYNLAMAYRDTGQNELAQQHFAEYQRLQRQKP